MTTERRPKITRRLRVRGSLGRTLLIAFLLLTLVPLVGISAVTIWRQYVHSRAQAIDQLTAVATLKEAEIKTWFNSLSPQLELVIADPTVHSTVARLIGGQQHNEIVLAAWRGVLVDTLNVALVARHSFDEVFLMDTSGLVVVSTRPGRQGQVLDTQPFFEQGLRSPYAQSSLYSGSYPSLLVYAAAPVKDETGAVRGVIAGIASLDALDEIMLERAGLGKTGETYLVGQAYVMLTEPRHTPPRGIPAVSTVGMERALSGTDGAGLYENYQSPPVPVVGVYRWIPELKVALLAEQSQAEAFVTTVNNIWLTVGIASLTAIVTVAASILVTRHTAAPLVHLTSIATRAARGDLTQVASVERDDEIGALAAAFNTMTAQLRELIEGLEERVAERTAELEAQKEALRQSEQRLSLHVQQTPLAVIEWTPGFKVVDWNPGAERIFGHTKDQAVGRHAAELIVPERAREHVDKIWAELLANKGGVRSTNENVTRDGCAIFCEWYNTPLIDQDGNVIGVASLAQDITERVRAEEQLQRASAELAHTNEELRQFAYIISHDLRAPLVNLKGFAAELGFALEIIRPAFDELLPHMDEPRRQSLATALHEDVPEALEFIGSSATRMDRFISALLHLSRLGRRELKLEPVDMNALVQASLKTVAHQLEERQVKVTVGSLPQVVADQTSMEQIVGNLLDNAVKYLDPGRPGEIEIGAECHRDETIIRVRDNGCGIAREDVETVFMPFCRIGRHAQDIPGEGMGLPYVQALVRRHGGRIWCESELGVGTTFSLTIPNHLVKGGDCD